MGPDGTSETVRLNLEEIAAELDAVAAALSRLDDGTYWTDEVTGEVIPDETLAANPTARRTS
jgi:RNA polymerase-binding transcription factor DksA